MPSSECASDRDECEAACAVSGDDDIECSSRCLARYVGCMSSWESQLPRRQPRPQYHHDAWRRQFRPGIDPWIIADIPRPTDSLAYVMRYWTIVLDAMSHAVGEGYTLPSRHTPTTNPGGPPNACPPECALLPDGGCYCDPDSGPRRLVDPMSVAGIAGFGPATFGTDQGYGLDTVGMSAAQQLGFSVGTITDNF
jgi:hypothetical protein